MFHWSNLMNFGDGDDSLSELYHNVLHVDLCWAGQGERTSNKSREQHKSRLPQSGNRHCWKSKHKIQTVTNRCANVNRGVRILFKQIWPAKPLPGLNTQQVSSGKPLPKTLRVFSKEGSVEAGNPQRRHDIGSLGWPHDPLIPWKNSC